MRLNVIEDGGNEQDEHVIVDFFFGLMSAKKNILIFYGVSGNYGVS